MRVAQVQAERRLAGWHARHAAARSRDRGRRWGHAGSAVAEDPVGAARCRTRRRGDLPAWRHRCEMIRRCPMARAVTSLTVCLARPREAAARVAAGLAAVGDAALRTGVPGGHRETVPAVGYAGGPLLYRTVCPVAVAANPGHQMDAPRRNHKQANPRPQTQRAGPSGLQELPAHHPLLYRHPRSNSAALSHPTPSTSSQWRDTTEPTRVGTWATSSPSRSWR